MSTIRILPEVLANKIAAGEVVERPASVVKELVENALDAEATRILIDIENGGRTLIRVADNGAGMRRDDALLSVERFATSKIHTDEDLFAISTLGFRGEALPSIAAVSKMTLVTRHGTSDSGVEIRINGGKIVHVGEAGAPPGTMISVAQLFYNTPARRKFLKGVATEMAHIADVAAAMALGRPQVHFKLTHNGRTVKQWSKAGDGALRTADVLGQVAGADLIALGAVSGSLKISGYLGPSRLARSTSRGIYLYVNGRRVRDRVIQHALFDGYSGRLMKGQFPLAVLFLELPFDQVDVNVHPTKHEIRFADQRAVHDCVRDQVAAALASAEKRLWALPESPPPDRLEDMARDMEPYRIPRPRGMDLQVSSPEPFVYQVRQDRSDDPPAGRQARATISPVPPAEHAPAAPYPVSETASAKSQQSALWQAGGFADLEVIGQCHGTYIICQSPRGLILIDQHAAHERIVYEQLKAGAGRIDAQRLLVPETVELGFAEARAMAPLIPRLNELGLELEPFGGQTFAVKSVPVLLDDRDIGRVIVELAEKAVEVGLAGDPEKILDACRMVMACHNAVRANQRLSTEQIHRMLQNLDRCQNPDHCPHGRPTWIQWRVRDLEKQFKRA